MSDRTITVATFGLIAAMVAIGLVLLVVRFYSG